MTNSGPQSSTGSYHLDGCRFVRFEVVALSAPTFLRLHRKNRFHFREALLRQTGTLRRDGPAVVHGAIGSAQTYFTREDAIVQAGFKNNRKTGSGAILFKVSPRRPCRFSKYRSASRACGRSCARPWQRGAGRGRRRPKALYCFENRIFVSS